MQSHDVTTSIIDIFSYLRMCLMASIFGPHDVVQLNSRSFPYIAQIIAGFRLNGPSTEKLTHSQLIRAVVVRLRNGCCDLCCLHVTNKSSLVSASKYKIRNGIVERLNIYNIYPHTESASTPEHHLCVITY